MTTAYVIDLIILVALLGFQLFANLEVYREVKREGVTWKEYVDQSQPFRIGRVAMTSYYWIAAIGTSL